MFAEKAFLGSIIKENYLIKETAIKPDHLQDTRHKELLKQMMVFHNSGKSLDLISLTLLPNLESFGGVSYLHELEMNADVEKFDEIEQVILDAWKEREKKNILQLATTNDWEIDKVLASLDKLNEKRVDDHTSINEALVNLYEAPWQEKEVKKGVPTGIKVLDDMTNGWQDGEVTIIAARPSMGKTDTMLHFAKQAGWHGHLPLLFSLEMPEKRLTERMIASTGGFNRLKMRNPYRYLTDEQKNTWTTAIGRVGETNIQIFDAPNQSISEMRAKTRKMMNQYPDKKPVIFIDYLGLIKPKDFYGGSANAQITEISRDLKTMAKEFNCPVICLAQLNRSVEQRQDKRPMMSDIRDSGSVEQDADTIIFLYRDKYYNKDVDDDTLEMIIAKNRNGPVGTVNTNYNVHTGVIEDVGIG